MTNIYVDGKALQAFTATVFEKVGLPVEDAAIEAEVLVWANLRGVDSHGVQRVAGYVRSVDAGHFNPRQCLRTGGRHHRSEGIVSLDEQRRGRQCLRTGGDDLCHETGHR